MYDRLEAISILFDYAMNKGFTNPLMSFMCDCIHSLHASSFHLVRSLHIYQPSRQTSAGMTADADGE